MLLIESQMKKSKIIPVITIDDPKDTIPLGKVLIKSGLPVAEITFRSEAAIEAIRMMRENYPNIVVGAGTVLNKDQVSEAKQAGASFIISPGLNEKTVEACRQLNIDFIPGVNNPSDIETAIEMGIDVLKFFPAEASGGVPMIKSLTAPYRGIRLIPTGGITVKNIISYLSIPQVIACGGTWMVDRQLISRKQWGEVSRLCLEVARLVSDL